jgi:hypothetical protein
LQQILCADVIARIDRRDGLPLDRRNLWIVVRRRLSLLEQCEMSPRDLTQLSVEVLDRHLSLAQDEEKGRQRRIGDAKGPAKHFIAVQQFGRDRPPRQDILHDVPEFGRRDSDSASAVERKRHVPLRAIDDRTAGRLRSHILR